MRETVARLAVIVLLGLFPSGPPHLDGDPVVLAQGTDAPGNAVAAGELLVEPPTLINLGFEWSIEGDGNRNAAVEVAYRRQGETAWSPALPLLRLQAVYDADDLDFRLRPGSAAVDRGTVLPTVTDGFTGGAPDLGALEVGVPAPHYGPRP